MHTAIAQSLSDTGISFFFTMVWLILRILHLSLVSSEQPQKGSVRRPALGPAGVPGRL